MAIHFSNNDRDGYFSATYIGRITDEEQLDAYTQFLQGDEWNPAHNELVDLSQADMTAVTSNGLRRVADFSRRVLEKNEVVVMKTAIYAPKPLPFGISRIYDVMADESPENVNVFYKKQDAEDWLHDNEADT